MKVRCDTLPSVLAFLASLSVSQPSWADSSEEQAARALFKEGLSRYEAHDYAGAIQKYREAYARWKNPKILANLGTAAWEGGRYVDAAQAYDRFLDEAPPNDPTRTEVDKARKEVLPKVGTLDIRVVEGSAAITIDGTSIDSPHLDRVRVEPGAHTVDAVGAGGLRGSQSANVAAGATVVIELHLTAPMTAPGQAPSAPVGEQRRRGLDLSTTTPLPWIAAGVGAAGLVTSAVFYFGFRAGEVNTLEQTCYGTACPESAHDTIDRANTFGLISAISLGVGIAGVGTGVVLFALDKKSNARENFGGATVSFAGSPSSPRVVARLRF